MILHRLDLDPSADHLMRTSSSLSLPDLYDIDISSDSDSSPDGLPSRTPSRLGFNNAVIAPSLKGDKTLSGTLKWTRRLFQRINLDDAQIEEETSAVGEDMSLSSSSEQGDEDSSSDSSDDSSEPDLFLFPHPPILALLQSNTTTSIRLRRPVRPTPARYNYPHRGHSRSALLHQKWFWHTRHEVWQDYSARQAYGGLGPTVPPLSQSHCDPPSLSPHQTSQPTTPILSQSQPVRSTPAPAAAIPDFMAPISIYPRSGDISALRDPYCATIDRCFCQFPIWTIHKSLFMFDMHHRAISRAVQRDVERCDEVVKIVVPNSEPVEVSCETGEDEAPPLSAGFSEADSDITLVEEDSSFFDTKNSEISDDTNASLFTWEGVRAWEITWYARWELLVELVKREDAFIKRDDMIVMPCAPVAPPPPVHLGAIAERPQMFYFAGENGEEDDDEEDYGTLVDNPLFTRTDIAF